MLAIASSSPSPGRVGRNVDRGRGPILVLLGRASQQTVKSFGVQSFVFEQVLRDQLEFVPVLDQDALGTPIGLVENLFDFAVDFLGGAFAAIALKRAVRTWKEHSVMPLS